MERKLASVQLIAGLEIIPNADQVVAAKVMGWTVVVKADEFAVGDRCVFFEVDSILPDGAAWAEFLRPRNFRVKTIKLRGVLSQGLALPMAILPTPCEVGDDVTAMLGITKYEPPIPKSLDAAGPFPGMIPKTDEIRVQSALGVLDEIRHVPFYLSVKCDGMSGTFAKLDGEFWVCSRQWALKPGYNDFWNVARKYELDLKLPDGFALQGEVCGPGIQKNRLGLSGVDVFAFNVFDIKAGCYLDLADFLGFCRDLKIPTVPIERVVNADELATFDFSLENFLALAGGWYAGTKNRREGIVVRPIQTVRSETLRSRLSFKVLNNEFLLNDED